MPRNAKDCQGLPRAIDKIGKRLQTLISVADLARHQVLAFSLFTRGSVPNSSAFACFVRWKWWLFVVLRRWQCLSAERLLFRDVSSVKLSIFLAPCHVNTGSLVGFCFGSHGFGAQGKCNNVSLYIIKTPVFWMFWWQGKVCHGFGQYDEWHLVTGTDLPTETLEECVECFYKQNG